jgi:uncharacterized protein
VTAAPAYAPGRHVVEAYGAGGFRFAGMSHVGSILATPRGIGAVQATAIAEVDAATLAPLFAELAAAPGAIEFLVVGTGAGMARLPAALAAALSQRGLRFEAMATGPATRAFNVMIEEGRRVAALLIAAP